MRKKGYLSGLTSLGARLKELRIKAGISQMGLAKMLGLNPRHGYKYILRLEKGLVPNPTLRTITGYLKACNATWKEIADVLSEITLVSPPSEDRETKPEPIVIYPYRPEKISTSPASTFANPPAYQVTSNNTSGTPDTTGLTRERFWQLVNQALDQGLNELRPFITSPRIRRLYHSFIRSACLIIARYPQTYPEQQLAKLAHQIEKYGADPQILNRLQTICYQIITQST